MLTGTAVDPVIQVRGDGDPVAVDVLAPAGLGPGLVAGGLGLFLGGVSADPPFGAYRKDGSTWARATPDPPLNQVNADSS